MAAGPTLAATRSIWRRERRTSTFEQAVKLTCYDQSVNQGGRKPGCIQRSINNNLASPNSQFPWAWQGSFGMAKQLGATMAFEADYVYSTSFDNIAARNPNTAYQANGLPFNVNHGQPAPVSRLGPDLHADQQSRPGWHLAHDAGRLHEASEQPLAGLGDLLV